MRGFFLEAKGLVGQTHWLGRSDNHLRTCLVLSGVRTTHPGCCILIRRRACHRQLRHGRRALQRHEHHMRVQGAET